MAIRLQQVLGGQLGALRFEPTAKRVRAEVDGVVAAESDRAMLVWEPRRVVPAYAVPVHDVRGELRAAGSAAPPEDAELSARPVWPPGVPFGVRTTEGERLELVVPGADRAVEAFRPADPDLADYVILDVAGARWFEEDEPIVGTPRDPFHRVDVRASGRHVQVFLDGQLLADSHRPRVVFETSLPPRYYLPKEDVVARLVPSDTHTICPYKGVASYWSVDLGDRVVPDLVWGYPEPLPDGAPLRDCLAFYDDKADVVVDGMSQGRG